MNQSICDKFDTELRKNSQLFVNENLIPPGVHPEQLFHLTSSENSKKIVEHQIIHASHIRSTLDPLEFALPMSACRDWFCFEKEVFELSL